MKLNIDEEKYLVNQVQGNNGKITITITPKFYNCFGCGKKHNRTRDYNFIQDDSIKNLLVGKEFCTSCAKQVKEIQGKVINTRRQYRW